MPGAANLSSVSALNASTIRVLWFAPPETEQNGQIVSFLINFSNSIITGPYNQTFATTLMYPISSTDPFSMNFTVEEAITYQVSVAVINGAGIGIASPTMEVTTPVAGVCVL